VQVGSRSASRQSKLPVSSVANQNKVFLLFNY